MVKNKVNWSHRAKISLFRILDFYAERNKSASYSKKLYKRFNKELSVLTRQPNIGIKTDFESVRGLIVDDFILFYEIKEDSIVVLTVWDCRQNPADLVIK